MGQKNIEDNLNVHMVWNAGTYHWHVAQNLDGHQCFFCYFSAWASRYCIGPWPNYMEHLHDRSLPSRNRVPEQSGYPSYLTFPIPFDCA